MLQHVILVTMVFFVICGARSPHAPQVLHSGSNGGMGETSGAEAGDDDERSIAGAGVMRCFVQSCRLPVFRKFRPKLYATGLYPYISN